MKRVLIIQTGGTILMQANEGSGGQVTVDEDKAKGYLLEEIPELQELAEIRVITPFFEDSSNLNPSHWSDLAQTIASQYESFDGFVILHGTDTMAYTASALSFALSPLTKPVILTGSQVPLTTLRSDAHRNLINAVEIATCGIPEVAVCFNDRLFRGNRVSKMSIGDFDAFGSPNMAPLAEIGLNIRFSRDVRKAGPSFHNTAAFSDELMVLKLYPGLRPDYLKPYTNSGTRALLIEGFGSGNFPVNGTHQLTEFLTECAHQNIIIAFCSQAPYDSVDLTKYPSGRKAVELGVLSAGAMTFEASLTKLMYLLAHHTDQDVVRAMFATDLAGELSIM